MSPGFGRKADGRLRKPTATETIVTLAYGWPEERISFGTIVDLLADRGFGLLIVILALPMALPLALPIGAMVGLPITFLAGQLALGFRHPWMPAGLRRRSFLTSDFQKIVGASVPLLRRLEKILKPRLPALTGWTQDRLVGLLIAILGVLLAAPIPLTNIPLALAIVFLALGLVEQDGLMTLLGIVVGLAGMALLGYFTVLSWSALIAWLAGWTG